MEEQKHYFIGDVAKILGISQRTIRYYEELEFIRPSRSEGRFRVYAESELNKLRTILGLKECGMSLEEIQELIKIGSEGSLHDISPKLREALLARKKELEEKIKTYRQGLKELEGSLSAIERCEFCNGPINENRCHRCMDQRANELTELIKALL